MGEYTEKMAAHAGHVHAFEPDPWAFGKLTERVGYLPNVTLHNAAVGTRDGTVTIRRAPDFDTNPEEWSVQTSVVDVTPDLEVGQTMEVDQVDFLAFLRSLERRADVVKMDIEGAEAPLLKTLFSSPELDLIGALFVETHEVNMPSLRPRIASLRRRARGLTKPLVNLDWP
jgi:FkbM family methyltransferase